MPPPPPPGSMLMQDREYGALGLAKIRTGSSDTPETIAAEEELKASWGGWCPPWGHTYYRAGNMLTFQGDDEGIRATAEGFMAGRMACHPTGAGASQRTHE